MLKTFGISALLLGSLIALVPQVASARDRDDYDRDDSAWERHERQEQREWREHQQHEWREQEQRQWRAHEQREWREHERSEQPYGYRYGYRGYYDRLGYWHAY